MTFDKITVLETIKGAKNVHPQIRFRCACGEERTARATKIRKGIITQCSSCAKAEAAKRGGVTRSLPSMERVVRNRFGEYRLNARAKNRVFEFSLDEFRAIVLQPCVYCGAEPMPINGMDRIDSSNGYIPSNVVPCCSDCNYAKRGLSASQFLSMVERIHEHQSVLQRDRSFLLRMAEQPDGCGPNQTWNDQRQVDSGSVTGRGAQL